ncbi:Protein of unknown function [Rhodovulum sp. ES.010]|nr:DUF2905 family protein [Rhodovulum sp. ES.010]SIO46046.1 Protein of unknown function [Rhodovulum sp. ES.010]
MIERESVRLYVPVTSAILVSAVLTGVVALGRVVLGR